MHKVKSRFLLEPVLKSDYAMDILLHNYIVRTMSSILDIQTIDIKTSLFSHSAKPCSEQYFIQMIEDDQ